MFEMVLQRIKYYIQGSCDRLADYLSQKLPDADGPDATDVFAQGYTSSSQQFCKGLRREAFSAKHIGEIRDSLRQSCGSIPIHLEANQQEIGIN